MTNYCAARYLALSTRAAVGKASVHANRLDASSQRRTRAGACKEANLHYLPWSPPFAAIGVNAAPPNGVDYRGDFVRMCAARGIGPGHGADPVIHLELVVSPAWIEAAGELNDPENSRNRALFQSAIQFCKTIFGQDSILSARKDYDERGGGVVDVFVAPEAISKRCGRYLSARPVLKELQKRFDRKSAFSALQDAWALFVQATLDPSIQRGKEKSGRGPDWVTPEVYAAQADLKKKEALLIEERAAFEAGSERLATEWDRLAAERAAFEAERDEWAATKLIILAERDAVEKNKVAIARDRSNLARDAEALKSEKLRHEAAATRLEEQTAAAEQLMIGAADGNVGDIDAASGQICFQTNDPVIQATLIRASKLAPVAMLTSLAAALRSSSAKTEATRKSNALEISQAREAAEREGFEKGHSKAAADAKKIPRLFEKAFAAYVDGRLALETRAEPNIVATCPDAEKLAYAARYFGFGEVFAQIADIMDALGPYHDAAMDEIRAMRPN